MDKKPNQIDHEQEYARENKRQLGLKSKSVQQRADGPMDKQPRSGHHEPQSPPRHSLFRAR
jgi:hypothetical protein